MNDSVFIVIIKDTNIIESAWSTERLAKAAIYLHSHTAKLPLEHYNIVERLINTTWIPK